jgi:hypothetical protein
MNYKTVDFSCGLILRLFKMCLSFIVFTSTVTTNFTKRSMFGFPTWSVIRFFDMIPIFGSGRSFEISNLITDSQLNDIQHCFLWLKAPSFLSPLASVAKSGLLVSPCWDDFELIGQSFSRNSSLKVPGCAYKALSLI